MTSRPQHELATRDKGRRLEDGELSFEARCEREAMADYLDDSADCLSESWNDTDEAGCQEAARDRLARRIDDCSTAERAGGDG